MRKAKISEFAEVITGGTPSTSISEYWENGTIPWLQSGACQNCIITGCNTFITRAGLDNSAAKMMKPDSVLIALTGATTGKVGYLTFEACANQSVTGIQPNERFVSKYLYYYLLGIRQKILDDSYGGAQKHISQGYVKNLEIPLGTIDEQRGIVEKFDHISQMISFRQQELQKIDNLIKARFVEMFGDPMINDKGYELKKYGEVFELNAGGTPSKTHPEYWDSGTISWIGSNMCQDRYLYENDGKYITQKGYDNSSTRLFPIDTVLVALVGATIGKTALLKFETTTNQNVLGIRGIRENGYLPEFVYYYTQGLYKKFMSISDGGFSMASKGFISELPIPVVSLALQREFARFVVQVDKSKVAVQAALDKAQLLFDSLMQEYFG